MNGNPRSWSFRISGFAFGILLVPAAQAQLTNGACCRTDGSCVVQGSFTCTSQGGVFIGFATNCTNATICDPGACCLPDRCQENRRGQCAQSSGEFRGLNSSCVGNCVGACCAPDQTCDELDPSTCQGADGAYQGPNTTCATTQCSGACCTSNGCVTTSPAACNLTDFMGLGTVCAEIDCVGSCCHSDTECFDAFTITSCNQVGGAFRGRGTRCASTDCFGACCLIEKACVETTAVGCAKFTGLYQGDGTTCLEECPSRVSTAFTYQGQLKQRGSPYSGLANMRFSLWDIPIDGQLIAGPIAVDSVEILNGLFVAEIDFGQDALNGNSRWLEVAVCIAGCAGPETFTRLEPRQLLKATPYATTALKSLQTVGLDGHSLNAADGDPVDALFVDTEGRISIGAPAPDRPLAIAGTGPTLEWISFKTLSNFGGATLWHINSLNNGWNLAQTGVADARLFVGDAGDVGVGTAAPLDKLDVRGNVKLGPSGEFFATSGEENLRIVRGTVSAEGGIIAGRGFTVAHPDNATYIISFNTPFAGNPSVTTAPVRGTFSAQNFIMINGVSSAAVTINIFNAPLNEFVDADFHFIAIGPR